MGGGVQERGDQASRRPGPKKRPERLSQLSLAQFLFLLDPASLPGGALPLVEKQPRECSQLLHSRQGAPPGRASPPPPPPQGAALGPRPPYPTPAVDAPWQCHSCSDSLENTSGVKVRRIVSTAVGMGFPLTVPSSSLRPKRLLPGSPTPYRELPPVPPRPAPSCSGNALGRFLFPAAGAQGDSPPLPEVSRLLGQRHASRHREPPSQFCPLS